MPEETKQAVMRHRSDPNLPAAEQFDLTRLTEDDMVHLMAEMMGEDPDAARAKADDMRGRLEGNQQR